MPPETVELALPETLSAWLAATARERGLTVNTLVQAAWGVLLGRIIGRDDVVFDSDPLAHRETLAPDSDELEALEAEDASSRDEEDDWLDAEEEGKAENGPYADAVSEDFEEDDEDDEGDIDNDDDVAR